MKLTIGQIKTAIIVGDLDSNLDDIKDAIATRNGMLEGALLRTLKVGDPVKFVENVKPTYLRGHKATVVSIIRKRIVVKLNTPVGRFSGQLTTPVSLIERV